MFEKKIVLSVCERLFFFNAPPKTHRLLGCWKPPSGGDRGKSLAKSSCGGGREEYHLFHRHPDFAPCAQTRVMSDSVWPVLIPFFLVAFFLILSKGAGRMGRARGSTHPRGEFRVRALTLSPSQGWELHGSRGRASASTTRPRSTAAPLSRVSSQIRAVPRRSRRPTRTVVIREPASLSNDAPRGPIMVSGGADGADAPWRAPPTPRSCLFVVCACVCACIATSRLELLIIQLLANQDGQRPLDER
jgi:hypothetical protein